MAVLFYCVFEPLSLYHFTTMLTFEIFSFAGLTIDYKNDELWWLNEQDLHTVKVYHSDLDGNSPTVFKPEITNFEALTILTLTVEDGWLFYASNDRTTDQSTLAWINQSGDNSTLEKLPGRMHSVLAMKVYKRNRADREPPFVF